MNKRKIFSELESESFLLCLDRFKSVIENKKTDAVTNREKASAWLEITELFNSFPGVVKREPKQLMTFYKNLKRIGNKSQASRRIQIFKTGGGPNVNTSANPVEERLLAMGALKIPLVNKYDSDAAYHKLTNNDSIFCENSCNLDKSHEEIEVKYASDNLAECLAEIEPSTYSGDEAPLSSNPEMASQETFTSIQSQGSLQTVCSQATNPNNTPHNINTSNKKVYKVRRRKRDLSAAAKAADSVIEQAELRKKFFNEQHEWEHQKFNLEKENFSIKKEKQLLKIKLLNEQLKMYQVINEKIEKGVDFQININK